MVRIPHCKCPFAQELFTLLGKKWVIFIIEAIDEGAHTFTDIRHSIGEANTKILTDRLTELVGVGIIEKTDTGNYILSKLGKDLSVRLIELAHWWGGKKNI
ncbi:helix-turn-helix transcriptional regulator [Candidatus Gracilibacteria bacterium]|nr:helix-turn-helix transcriptional regulator [Candidatus Gracilibacteria bacterium]